MGTKLANITVKVLLLILKQPLTYTEINHQARTKHIGHRRLSEILTVLVASNVVQVINGRLTASEFYDKEQVSLLSKKEEYINE